MANRDRRQIRYDQFVKKPRRRWVWFLLLPALVLAGAGLWWVKAGRTVHTPPPALSNAGGPVANETYQWAHVAVGGGGFITGFSQDATGTTMVVRSDVYGAYVWDAKDNAWNQLVTADSMPADAHVQAGMAAGAYEAVVAPSQPARLYLAIKGQVYRSDDRGESWKLASKGLPTPLSWDANDQFRLRGPFLAVHPSTPDLVLLGSPGNGLWRSQDGGGSWQPVPSMPGSIAPQPGQRPSGILIWFEPSAGVGGGRIFAMAASRGMYVSTDAGRTFKPLGADGHQPMSLRRGAFDRTGTFYGVDDVAKTVWCYRDGIWHDLGQEAGLPATEYAAVAANPRSDQVVVFDQGGKGWQSVDRGAHWTTVSHSATVGSGDPPWLRVSDAPYFATADIRFDAVTPNRLWVAAGMGVFYADLAPGNSHAEWVSQTRGIEELVANDIIQPPGQSPVFAGWDFGLHVKDVLDQYSTTFGPNERTLISVQQLDWSPSDPAFLVTNASDARVGCCWEDGNAVMAGFSKDGGRSWSKFATLPTPEGAKADDPWRMSFGSIAVSAGSTDNIVWAPAYNRTPQYTLDRGATWSPIILAGEVGPTTGSFQEMFYQRKTLAADKVRSGVFYLYHSGEAPNQALVGLWRTSNGGRDWERVFPGPISSNGNMAAKLRAVPGKAGNLFFTAAVLSAEEATLRRSYDGGSSWTLLDNVTHVDDIAFGKPAPKATYPTIFISGRVRGSYGVWRSIDNATSWQRVAEFPAGSLDQVTVVAADPDVFGRVYLGYQGSGWIWGEPATCSKMQKAPVTGQRDCFKVQY